MSLNIKDERVHALARRAAQVTGKSQTRAVEEALELLLSERELHPAVAEQQARLDTLRRISLAWQPSRARSEGAVADVEDLYDPATGLPA